MILKISEFTKDLTDEVIAMGEEYTEEELIPALVQAIRILSLRLDYDKVLDEVARLLEGEDDYLAQKEQE